MTSPRWIMEQYGAKGGIGGEGIRNLLAAPGFEGPEDVVARESIQNSADAKRDGGKVRVVFRRRPISGTAKTKFFGLVGLGDELTPRLQSFAGHGATDEETKALRLLGDPQEAVELLYIEDFNTIGLGGDLTDPDEGHFYRLLFLVGDGDKGATAQGTGGSYGYGKSVYASTSSLFTILTYSRFAPTTATKGVSSRLLGSTFLRKHRLNGKHFTGRGWFGLSGTRDDDPAPIVNEQADELAQKLGFTKRGPNDTGTSMLILGASFGKGVDMGRLRAAIETWWWPRLIDDEIDIELYEVDTKLPSPRPRSRDRDDLRPYIQCYAAIQHDDSSGPRVRTFNAHHGIELGTIGIVKLEQNEADDSSDTQDNDEVARNAPGRARVALMRAPKMVVAYAELGSQRMPPAVGVFVADDDETTDKILKLSEPPQHDKWDPHAQRLSRMPHGSQIVEAVLKRSRKEMKDFQRQLTPPKPKPKERLRWFDKILGKALSSVGKAPTPPAKGEQGDVSIHFPGLRTVEADGRLRIESDVVLQLRDRFEAESARARVCPTLHVLEGTDAHRDRSEVLPLQISRRDDGSIIDLQQGGWFDIDVHKSESVRLHIASSTYDPEWSVELTVTAEPVKVTED